MKLDPIWLFTILGRPNVGWPDLDTSAAACKELGSKSYQTLTLLRL